MFTARWSGGLDCTPHFSMYGLLLVFTEHATSECECDRGESSLHILLSTHSLWVVGFLHMGPYLPRNNTTKPLTQERSYSALGTECVFHSLYSHEHSDFKIVLCVRQCLIRPLLLLALRWAFQPLCTAVLVNIRKSKKPFPHLIISILHAAHSLATASAVHCMRSNSIRQSTHKKTYSSKLPTGCRFVRKLLSTNSSLV